MLPSAPKQSQAQLGCKYAYIVDTALTTTPCFCFLLHSLLFSPDSPLGTECTYPIGSLWLPGNRAGCFARALAEVLVKEANGREIERRTICLTS